MQESEERVTLAMLTEMHDRLCELLEQNTNLRMKYATEPMKFIESESDIHGQLKQLEERVGSEHIPIFIEAHLQTMLMELMQHPNLDISSLSLEILHGLLKEEQEGEEERDEKERDERENGKQNNKQGERSYEIWWRCVLQLMENGLMASIIDILTKLDEEGSIEEYDCAYKCLQSLQILISMYTQAASHLGREAKLIAYLLNRILPNFTITHKAIDDNKTISSEILSIILTTANPSEAIPLFTLQSGMEVLIECIRPFAKQPQPLKSSSTNKSTLNSLMAEEKQFLSNVLDCMRVAVMASLPEGVQLRQVYAEMHGDRMMLWLLRSKSQFAQIALKVMASSLVAASEEESQVLVKSLLEMGVLKYVPPILLRQGLSSTDSQTQYEIDQCALQILYSLVRYSEGIDRIRVESKLCEKRWQKLERIFQLRNEYIEDETGNDDDKQGGDKEEEMKAQEYIGKLKQGLSIVQIIDKIIISLLESASTLKQRLITLLSLHAIKSKQLARTLKLNYKFIGDSSQRKYLQILLARVAKL